ncbi:hypothetical protein BD324DRAFT_209742 [Kockovaella imperatae]|uniref:IMD domain-containing protein n=1 Tax=Kockovaella imperatae TaxID=4999 RepID=A0A1Y1U986_9TREE|nr:hypothetical protein BD324DRAFT_209742 [Kockovaella imperatae]ORX33655.1 hypothetical protein BD324DRAFT_209742 [Kockovaella imperatae]
MATATPRPRYDSTKSNASSIAWGVPRPPSPSYSTTTTGSRVNATEFHTLITRKDLRQSIACFEDLMSAAKAYRNALLAMSSATASFATAMEACSRVKGCRSANAGMLSGGGLQHLIANHEQILADTVYRQFEIPLLEALDHYKLITADRLIGYEKSLHEQSAKIRKTEAENHKVGRRKKRDLQQFRQALAELQKQVDELDAIKAGYHEEVLEGEDEVWDKILGKVAFVVRSQLDFYEKIAGKTSDPILEPLVMSIPDPFDSYGPPKEEGQIISVLSPLGLMDSTPATPNLRSSRSSRLDSPSSASPTPGRSSPRRSNPFPAAQPSPSPSQPQTSSISAMGVPGSSWSEDETTENSRAKRELSVIDEREGNDGSLTSPITSPVKPMNPDESPDWAGSKSATEESRDTEDQPTVNDVSDEGTPAIQSRKLRGVLGDPAGGHSQEA